MTQQEQGVSKRVAVKFDQVQQGGKISDAAIAQAEREAQRVEAARVGVEAARVEAEEVEASDVIEHVAA